MQGFPSPAEGVQGGEEPPARRSRKSHIKQTAGADVMTPARRDSARNLRKRKWCPGRESNPYALRHKILSLVCLPFHHPDTCGGLI